MVGYDKENHVGKTLCLHASTGAFRSGKLAPMGVAFYPAAAISTASAHSVGEVIYLSPEELECFSVEYALTRDARLREVLILHHQRLVRSLALRFVGLGETLDDLIQVGNIGLINALDRFSPRFGTRFSTYATPTILGEIRRHFRDKAPAMKAPRWMADLQRAARKALVGLTHELGRHPTTAELARRLGESEDRLLQALESSETTCLLSLDALVERGSGSSSSLEELIGDCDVKLCELEAFGDLRAAMTRLDEREREVIALRFFDELSQACIARRLNVSQMHVSRLQQKALRRLRELMAEESLPASRN